MPRKINSSYEDLVLKAQNLFWVNGYKAVTPEQLAKHLDVSVSSIYNKYTKELLFVDSLDAYIKFSSDPVLQQIRNTDLGIESFRSFFYLLIDALLDGSFPRSCLVVNTVVEIRKESDRVCDFYEKYFGNMEESYRMVLERAVKLGEIKHPERLQEYNEFLQNIIFSMSILYRVKSKEELRSYVDEQLSMIV